MEVYSGKGSPDADVRLLGVEHLVVVDHDVAGHVEERRIPGSGEGGVGVGGRAGVDDGNGTTDDGEVPAASVVA